MERRSIGVGAPPKDDFHGIAITPGGASLAWTRGGGIDVAFSRAER